MRERRQTKVKDERAIDGVCRVDSTDALREDGKPVVLNPQKKHRRAVEERVAPMTVAILKAELEKRHLPTRGLKAVLRARLLDALYLKGTVRPAVS